MGPEYERLSEADRLVLEGLRSAGEAWIVGGWVREAFSDSDYNDIDIATTLLPAEVKKLFPRSLMVGEKYGTVIVRLENNISDGTSALSHGRGEVWHSDCPIGK